VKKFFFSSSLLLVVLFLSFSAQQARADELFKGLDGQVINTDQYNPGGIDNTVKKDETPPCDEIIASINEKQARGEEPTEYEKARRWACSQQPEELKKRRLLEETSVESFIGDLGNKSIQEGQATVIEIAINPIETAPPCNPCGNPCPGCGANGDSLVVRTDRTGGGDRTIADSRGDRPGRSVRQ